MRERFNKQIDELKGQLETMSQTCIRQLEQSTDFLFNGDTLPESVILNEIKIKEYRRSIEIKCNNMLLFQQPVASDFHLISRALKAVTDFERIGSQCVDMCEAAREVQDMQLRGLAVLHRLADAVLKMLTDSIYAFLNENISLSAGLRDFDNEVDSLFEQARGEIIELIGSCPENGAAYLDIFAAAKYLERIADHAENLGKWVKSAE